MLRQSQGAITRVESSLPKHQELIAQVIDRILPFTGNDIRVGITGVSGVGKSTFIEALGMNLVERGLRIAILAVEKGTSTPTAAVKKLLNFLKN